MHIRRSMWYAVTWTKIKSEIIKWRQGFLKFRFYKIISSGSRSGLCCIQLLALNCLIHYKEFRVMLNIVTDSDLWTCVCTNIFMHHHMHKGNNITTQTIFFLSLSTKLYYMPTQGWLTGWYESWQTSAEDWICISG